MEKITIQDMRRALLYVNTEKARNEYLHDLPDEDLLKLDFSKDLQMGNIRLTNIVIELERVHSLSLPLDIFRKVPNNTVGAFMKTVNQFLSTRKLVKPKEGDKPIEPKEGD